MRIIMLPCAGGNGLMFQSMSNQLSKHMKVIIYDYPGHGRRIQLPLLRTVKALVSDFIDEMIKQDLFNGEPYMLLGYSMGSQICHEVVLSLVKRNLELPQYLFLCASSTKSLGKYEQVHSYSNEELYTYLKKLGGTSNELLDSKEFQEFYFPIIEADLSAINSYKKDTTNKIPVKATILYGSKDKYSEAEMYEWKNYIQSCSFKKIEGGHFFIYTSEVEITNIIIETITT